MSGHPTEWVWACPFSATIASQFTLFVAPARPCLRLCVFSVFRNCEATLRLVFEIEFEQIWRQMHILKH